MSYVYADYEVKRDLSRCTLCGACVKQCFNGVHTLVETGNGKKLVSDESKCVNCHRCVSLCPSRAIKIVKSDLCFKRNDNWSDAVIKEIYKQAESGGVLAVVQMILPWITHGVLRKAAHFLEFAVLGILLTGTFHGARNFTLAKPMLFAVLTAMTDETIQAFTPGRNCALSDVWLDAAGALTGAVLLWLIFKLRKK